MSSKGKIRLFIYILLLITALLFYVVVRPVRKSAEMKEVITLLQSPDLEVRTKGYARLQEMTKHRITVKQGIIALESAANEFPPLKPDYYDSSEELVNAAASNPHPDYIPVIYKYFPEYAKKSKERALALLINISTRDAAIAYMNLIKKYARLGILSRLPTWSPKENFEFGNIIFPDILEFLDIEQYEWDVLECTLAYLQAKAVPANMMSRCTENIIEKYYQYKDDVFAFQHDNGRSWIWDDEYQSKRCTTGLLLDIMGYYPDVKIESELKEALSYTDQRLQMFALLSLLRLGKDVDKEIVLGIAKVAENRNVIYDGLCELGKTALFPDEYRTQALFAESNMVNWLIYPTELGREPDEIELMKVISRDPKDGHGFRDFYVFRFRTFPPHWAAEDGWMAGVAGPYLRNKAPSTTSYGGTFSCFEPWDNKTPEEHFKQIQNVFK